ncbi:MAG: S41 family peptidase [Paludibacteraceae bacterium]|nr:S41 family peptidase [Paludibacteraceae bacterium]
MRRLFLPLILLAAPLFLAAQSVSKEGIKLAQSLSLIESAYVDTINSENIAGAAIRAMLKELDPHSSYVPAAEVAESREGLEGNFEGIGVTFMMLNDTIMIDQVIQGCPAEKSGILPGDRFTHVDGKAISGVKMKLSDVPKLIRGPKGTTVNITVFRPSINETIEFKLTRDKIPIHSVDAAFYVAPGIGYIKVSSFSVTTAEEFSQALNTLSKSGKLQSLIIDLQSNGGGVMNAAIQLASNFLPRGREVVSMRGVHLPTQVSKSEGYKQYDIPVAVLVNEYTASASEIVSGALQDWDRATIIGRRTFGKGLVQRIFPMNDGSEVRLTIARYYTPSGRNIQKPYKGGVDNYYKDIENRYKHGEMVNPDSVQFPDSLKYSTLLKHRTIYGGGGIFPDIFVPLDTAFNTPLYRKLVAKGIITKSCRLYTDKNREKLIKQFADFEAFNVGFNDEDKIRKSIEDEAKKEKIEFSKKDIEEIANTILVQAKAIIAQSVYGPEYYYHVISPLNDELQKAIQFMTNK